MRSLYLLPLALLPLLFTKKAKKQEWDIELGDAVIEDLDPINRLVTLALEDEQAWEGLSDTDEDAEPLLERYWQMVGYSEIQELPWSGAWIAWATNTAIPGSLPKLAQHSSYARAMLNDNRPLHFQTLDPKTPVEVGDIVLKPRAGEERFFEDLLYTPFVPFPSHGDIIVNVGQNSAVAIGGNKIGHKVAKETYPLRPDGTIPGLYAIMRLSNANA